MPGFAVGSSEGQCRVLRLGRVKVNAGFSTALELAYRSGLLLCILTDVRLAE